MMVLSCPWCGPRNATEFRYGGENHSRPDPNTATAQEWRRFLFMKSNPLGPVQETWYHRAGCRKYFSVERDTGTNENRPLGADR
ncbi:sarcosine oxidase subunit delta [Pseudonocardia sp. C8]|uniref:sarcosine oxidase subunit delta n=1 Tax=Pseudonocardia sp. C8 TaxID=2762759 RepID=UPI0016424D84|nr:sarcosine oxidase subunit delta [Pseudonocardia sp. C8]MBC3190401.1 sarcosine oxidase subunit delta [Pseudonocardia sp. C8]